jgi:hypothetical protein
MEPSRQRRRLSGRYYKNSETATRRGISHARKYNIVNWLRGCPVNRTKNGTHLAGRNPKKWVPQSIRALRSLGWLARLQQRSSDGEQQTGAPHGQAGLAQIIDGLLAPGQARHFLAHAGRG